MTTTNDHGIPRLIAHRGYASRYPENSLAACEAALLAGACYIEIDIQLTADGVPVLFHDQTLQRTTGANGLITDLDSQDLHRLDAAERQRLGDTQPTTAVPTLAAFIQLLQQWPQARAFIEIKEESLAAFGHQRVLKQVLKELAPLQSRCIPISYDVEILELFRQQGPWQIGWVARRYDESHRQLARSLSPDYLICNHQKTGNGPLWPGPWQWALYEVIQPQLALQLYRRGAALIETMAISDMLQDPTLARAACPRNDKEQP